MKGNATPLALGSVPVSLTVSVNLSGLHPAATNGALECGAVAQTKAWIDAHRDSLVDYDTLYRWVLGPAHYYSEKAILEFPIANGSYVGALTYTTALNAGALLDSSTRAAFAPNPSIIVACWLQINGRPAVWDQGTGLLVVSSSNFASVNQKPLIIAVAETGAGTPVNVTGQLSAQGLYFSPGPVALVEDLAIAGPNISPSALATSGSAPQVHTSASKQATAPSVAPTPAELAAQAAAGKTAAMVAAVAAVQFQAIEEVIELAYSFGCPVTSGDEVELTQAASETSVLSVVAMVAALVSATDYILTNLPTLDTTGANGSLPAQAYQLTPQQVQLLILSVPTPDASASRLSNDVKALLRKIKTRG